MQYRTYPSLSACDIYLRPDPEVYRRAVELVRQEARIPGQVPYTCLAIERALFKLHASVLLKLHQMDMLSVITLYKIQYRELCWANNNGKKPYWWNSESTRRKHAKARTAALEAMALACEEGKEN